MIDREWLATAMQDRYAEAIDDQVTERCSCGHSPRQHRSVRNQYKRPDTDPCDFCSCLSYEEASE